MEVQDVESCCSVVTLTEAFSLRTPVSFSAVVIHPSTGVVITTGLPFFRFIIDKKSCYANECRFLLRHNFRDNFKIDISIPSRSHVEANECDVSEVCPSSRIRTHEHKAELLMLVNCVEFKKTFKALFHEADQWRFHGDEDDGLIRDAGYLSWFAVLKVDAPHSGAVSWRRSSSLQKGFPVVACGSPFGSLCSDLFNGTVSRGVVSNLAGEGNAVILTDARCLPGTEGGGLFVIDDDDSLHLVGVIVSPFGWKANEWIGLTLVCSFNSILRNVVQCADVRHPLQDVLLHPAEILTTQKSNADQYPNVCLVDSGQHWGSGVLVTSELVLTCRHVVDGKSTVALKFHQGDRVFNTVGDVLFSTKTSSPYDVAVVRSRESILDAIVPQMAHEFIPGDSVLVVGYGGLGRRCGPSLTCGVLSKAISHHRCTIMLQTTCAVQAGASGGAVVRASTGELLGIVSSNTRDLSSKVTYPHLNFCVPVSVLQEPLLHLNRLGDVRAFDALDAEDEQVKRAWRLQGTQSKL